MSFFEEGNCPHYDSKNHFPPRLQVDFSQLSTNPMHYLYTPSAQGMFVEGNEGRKVMHCGPKLPRFSHSFPAQFWPSKYPAEE
jgi:pantothenate synthetase